MHLTAVVNLKLIRHFMWQTMFTLLLVFIKTSYKTSIILSNSFASTHLIRTLLSLRSKESILSLFNAIFLGLDVELFSSDSRRNDPDLT